MAISFDLANAVVHEGPDSGGPYNSDAVSFAVNANGADGLLLFIGGLCDGSMDLTGASIQYAGSQTFTEITQHGQTNTPGGDIWSGYITSPTAGSNNVTFTMAASGTNCDSYVAVAIPFSGFNTSTPIITAENDGGPDSTATASSASYTGTANQSGDVAILGVFTRDATTPAMRPFTPGTGDDSLLNGFSGTGTVVDTSTANQTAAITDSTTPNTAPDGTIYLAYEVASGAGSVTVAATAGDTNRLGWQGFIIQADTGGGGGGNPHYYYAQQ